MWDTNRRSMTTRLLGNALGDRRGPVNDTDGDDRSYRASTGGCRTPTQRQRDDPRIVQHDDHDHPATRRPRCRGLSRGSGRLRPWGYARPRAGTGRRGRQLAIRPGSALRGLPHHACCCPSASVHRAGSDAVEAVVAALLADAACGHRSRRIATDLDPPARVRARQDPARPQPRRTRPAGRAAHPTGIVLGDVRDDLGAGRRR